MSPFWAKYILFELKKYRGVFFHETEEGYKIWKETDLSFQNWHKEFDRFWPGHSKVSKNFHFNRLHLRRVYIAWAKKVQRNYLSWNWKRIQNLERNRLVVSKFTQGISEILNWALESLKNIHFNGLFLSKVYIVWAKKMQRNYLSWHWKTWRKTDLSFGKWHDEFGKISP